MRNDANVSPEWERQHPLPPAYPFHPEDENEVTRLLLQHRHLSECMGGILPASLDLSKVRSVLDVACGASGWVYELAWRYPSMQVTGMEGRAYFARQAQALVKPLGNATIVEQDLHHLSDEVVPAGSFDLVHARFLVSELAPGEYPSLLSSLVRLCRPGGLFVWEELEFPITNSAACQEVYALVQDGLRAAGRAFCPGCSLGITAMMSSWLKGTGCRITLDRAYAVEVSRGTTGHDAFARQMWALGKQLRPFLVQAGVTSEEAFDALCAQALREILADGFCGLLYVRTLVGVK